MLKTVNTASFSDPEHPLRTDDEDAQRQIAERIKKRKKTLKVNNEDLGVIWGFKHSQASNLVRSPQKMSYLQVEALAKKLECTTDWLRYGGENRYGKFPDTTMVAALYDRLQASDKELAWDILKRLAGDGLVSEVELQAREERLRGHLEMMAANEEKAIDKAVKGMREVAKAFGLQDRPEVSATIKRPANKGRQERKRRTEQTKPIRDIVAHQIALEGYGVEDLAAADRRLTELEASGIDTDYMTLGDLLS